MARSASHFVLPRRGQRRRSIVTELHAKLHSAPIELVRFAFQSTELLIQLPNFTSFKQTKRSTVLEIAIYSVSARIIIITQLVSCIRYYFAFVGKIFN